MKTKITAFFLVIVFALAATVFATACGDDTDRDPSTQEHSHSYVLEVAEEEYLASAATCTEPAKYYKSCECGAKGTETFAYGQPKGHSYVKEVAEEEYLASAATCTEPAEYYKSCECGAKGTETFAYGQPVHASISYDLDTIGGEYKTDYLTGEVFDMTGMTVKGKCSACETEVTAAVDGLTGFTVTPEGPLDPEITKVTVALGDQSKTINITVTDPHVDSWQVTDVDLEESGDAILYVVEGTYTGTMTKDVFYLDLSGDQNHLYTADKTNIDLTLSEKDGVKTFRMTADVSGMSANTTSMYPHLWVHGKMYDVTGPNAMWNGIKIEKDDYKYEIIHNDNMSSFPWMMPVVSKSYTGEVPSKDESSYTTDKVYLEEENGRVYYVIEGTSQGYTHSSLTSYTYVADDIYDNGFVWELRTGDTTARHFYFDGKLSMEADGSYTAKMDITGIAASETAYYTRISADLENFNEEWISRTGVDTESSVTVGGLTYKLVFGTDKSSAAEGYGTVSVLCSKAAAVA